jgi:hypothetical protein
LRWRFRRSLWSATPDRARDPRSHLPATASDGARYWGSLRCWSHGIDLRSGLDYRRSRCRKDSIPRLGPRLGRDFARNRNHASASRGPGARTSDHASHHQVLRRDWPVRPLSEQPQPRYAPTESRGHSGPWCRAEQWGRGDSEGQEASIGEYCRDRSIASLNRQAVNLDVFAGARSDRRSSPFAAANDIATAAQQAAPRPLLAGLLGGAL